MQPFDKAQTGLFALLVILAGAACSSSATEPTPTAPTVQATTAPQPVVTFSLTDAIVVGLQDEYHAEAVYKGVLADLGNVMPFANVIRAEQTHAASLATLLSNRGIAVPASVWHTGNVPHFATLREACAAAAQAEVDNIAVYDRYLGENLPDDVRRVFQNNRLASLNNHLPAFNRCR